MNKKVSILLVGAGGYGNSYLRWLFSRMDEGKFSLVGIVDPYPQGCNYLKELEELKVPFFKTIEEFYSENSADLAIISSPIQYHTEQSCYAMMHGSNVLCEKPICAVIQDAYKMKEVRDKTGKFLAIGYQLSFSDAMLSLKKDVMEGILGKPIRMKSIALWPRNKKYFSRKWAAKKKDEQGKWVLDSVANNATAHHLNNILFILGKEISESEYPVSVTAELYRANDIENFDTVAARIYTKNNVEILYYATHAVNENIGPIFCYEFENAVVTYEDKNKYLIAKFNDGTFKNYGDPYEDVSTKLWKCIEAVENPDITIPSSLEAAMPHLICVNGMQESVPDIVEFPESMIKIREEQKEETQLVWVEGLKEVLLDCFDNWTLPSEKGITWAKAGKTINLEGYNAFRG